MFQKVVFTSVIVVCALAAILGVAYTLWFVFHPNEKYFKPNYRILMDEAPDLKGFLHSFMFAVCFISALLMAGTLYCTFTRSTNMLAFFALEITAAINLYFMIRLNRVERAYIDFIYKQK